VGGRFLVTRDPGLIAPAQPLSPPFVWDGRFMVTGPERLGWHCAALGAAAVAFRHQTKMPIAALRALPALWNEKGKLAVLPGLFYADPVEASAWRMVFAPRGGALPPG
jgi:hypothetical protein